MGVGLQVREETLKHKNGYLVKSCKDLQTTKSKEGNFGKTGQQHVEMVWTQRIRGG